MGNDTTKPHPQLPTVIKLRTHKIHVEFVAGPDAGKIVELPGPEVRIGSGVNCDCVLKDKTVSRMHLALRVHNDLLRVVDLGSRNGTTIDGTLIHDAYARPDSVIAIGNTTLRMRMLSEVVELPLSKNERFGRLMGRSVAMRRLFALLERFAPTDKTILIEGETGTGKELAAEAIHRASDRARGPFIVFDCSAFPPSAIAAALFGQVCGSRQGEAVRIGCFEQANGGTLFLDEVAELPLDLQPKILRAIEKRAILPLGKNGPACSVDVRIIVATNRNLAYEVDRGRFRDDLYYRLAVVTARIPPLRERHDDIPLLVRHFEREYASAARQPAPMSDELVQEFARRMWPGNVRELKNQVEVALYLSHNGSHPVGEAQPAGPIVSGVYLAMPILVGREHVANAYEKAYLELLLEKTGGNVSRAAELAGVGRRWIQKAMKQYGLRGRS